MATVKGAVRLFTGKWYFEIVIQGDGMLQVGAVASGFVADSARNKGVGDDSFSWALDGCRMVTKHNRLQHSLGRHPWKDGDIVGCMLDCDASTISFTVDGQLVRDLRDTGDTNALFVGIPCSGGICPALSLEPDNAVQVIFDAEGLSFLPEGYKPLSNPGPTTRCVQKYFCMPQESQSPTTKVEAYPLLSTFACDAALVTAISGLLDLTTQPLFSWRSLLSSHRSVLVSMNIIDESKKFESVYLRALLLVRCSTLIQEVLPFVPFLGGVDYGCDGLLGPLAACVSRLKPLFLPFVGFEWMTRCISSTNGVGEPIKLTINRRKASLGRHASDALTSSVFGQIFSLIGDKPSPTFCTSKRLWTVVFAGEGADDVGGPYRESIADICDELMSESLPLFVPSPNQSVNHGESRDRFVCNSSFGSAYALSMFFFLGKIIGGCLRSGEPLALYLPSAVWKRLVGETPTTDDLDSLDRNCVQSLAYFSECAQKKSLTDEELREVYDGNFVTNESNGREVELFPGGSRIGANMANLALYVKMVLHHRLNVESSEQWDALIAGFHRVVPLHYVALLRWDELERLVCGRPDFVVDELRQSVRFEGLLPDDRRVLFLWQVLAEFTRHERALFARFVSGRERLPPSVRLKLMPSVPSENEDLQLPNASTCFFWLSIPNYSTLDVMKKKLQYAIHYCLDIDADFRVRDTDEDVQPLLTHTEEEEEGEFEDYSHLL